jgi:hypothetical protein
MITTCQSPEHISGNKSPMRSTEVPIDREYPDEEPVKFSR